LLSSSILCLIVGCIIATNIVTNTSIALSVQNQNMTSDNPRIHLFATLSVGTDRPKYVESQSIRISGTVYDEKGGPVNFPITVKVQEYYLNGTSLLTGKTVYSVLLIPNNGKYTTVISNGLTKGEYNITSFITFASSKAYNISTIGTSAAATDVTVENVFLSTPFMILYIGLGISIPGLLIVAWRREKQLRNHPNIKEDGNLPQFIFFTILAFTPIAALALTDVELFPNAPVGLIIKPSAVVTSQNVTQSVGEWMINIGGSSSDKYKLGIQIPIAIIIFGIGGGYLRYLFSQAEKRSKNAVREGTMRQDSYSIHSHVVFQEILFDVALLFLSPLLAIAVWLALVQGGLTSAFTLAAVSFVIGLVTKEAGRALVGFARKILETIEGPKAGGGEAAGGGGEAAGGGGEAAGGGGEAAGGGGEAAGGDPEKKGRKKYSFSKKFDNFFSKLTVKLN
jgi:hypothetical protein